MVGGYQANPKGSSPTQIAYVLNDHLHLQRCGTPRGHLSWDTEAWLQGEASRFSSSILRMGS